MIDYIERSDQSEDGEGIWMLCTRCEGCWRPNMQEKHEDGCPVAEVRRLRAALRHIADANLSPCVRFAEYILDGYGVADAHRLDVSHASPQRLNGIAPVEPHKNQPADRSADQGDDKAPGMPAEEMLRCARQLVRTGRHDPQFDTFSTGQHKAAQEFDEALPRMMDYLLSAELRPRRARRVEVWLEKLGAEAIEVDLQSAVGDLDNVDPTTETRAHLTRARAKLFDIIHLLQQDRLGASQKEEADVSSSPRPNHLKWNGTEWVDERCGCRYHPDDDKGTHEGAPHLHLCTKHRSPAPEPT